MYCINAASTCIGNTVVVLYTIIHTEEWCNRNISMVIWEPTNPIVANVEKNETYCNKSLVVALGNHVSHARAVNRMLSRS